MATAKTATASKPEKVRKSARWYTVEEMCEALRKTKGMRALAAQLLGCDVSTVYRFIERHPTVAKVAQAERELQLDMAELKLFQQIQKGEGWATCFFLKTQGRGRGYVERQEITGPAGGPLEMAHLMITTELSGDQRAAMLEMAGKRQVGAMIAPAGAGAIVDVGSNGHYTDDD